MNNNNRGNNRRRGRGNRQNGGGSGQQLNRIDSRARGNAPQLLEKYRKLAQDAHLNGDRVQAEYYLQFADHYFRVLADTRQRQEEQRNRPQGERWQDNGDDGDESGDFHGDADFPSFDQPSYNRPQRAPRQAQGERNSGDEREDEPRAADRNEGNADDDATANPYEPAENPFVREREPRGGRGLRPRREARPRGDEAREESTGSEGEAAGLDPTLLPPAISTARDEAPAAEAEAKPRRGRPRKKPLAGDAGEPLESVN